MNTKAKTFLALSLTMIFWGLSFIGTKIALTSFTPFIYIFFRFILASMCFLLLFLYRGFPKISTSDHKKLFITALFQPGLYFTFETLSSFEITSFQMFYGTLIFAPLFFMQYP
ncbi:MAG: EamA family transporter [Bacillota bacterium]|nr:EamA family transporter [Bacillota bacterium]